MLRIMLHTSHSYHVDTGCRVLSYKAFIPVLEKEFGHHPNKKDLYFIGDSLGTQQYLAANCDFEIEKSNIDIKFIVRYDFVFLPRAHLYLFVIRLYCISYF